MWAADVPSAPCLDSETGQVKKPAAHRRRLVVGSPALPTLVSSKTLNHRGSELLIWLRVGATHRVAQVREGVGRNSRSFDALVHRIVETQGFRPTANLYLYGHSAHGIGPPPKI